MELHLVRATKRINERSMFQSNDRWSLSSILIMFHVVIFSFGIENHSAFYHSADWRRNVEMQLLVSCNVCYFSSPLGRIRLAFGCTRFRHHVTWLILPVVHMLVSRLSHACLSISVSLRNCEWLIKTVIVSMSVDYYLDIRGNSS